jgi:DNA mismatch repair protein MSH5
MPRASYGASSRSTVSSSPAIPGSAARSLLHSSPIALSRSSIYSPQLPAHPNRQRLSLRSPSLQRASATAIQRNNADDEDDGLAEDHVPGADADALHEVIMAIDIKDNGNLGCAYYIAAGEILYLLEDIAVAGNEILETLLLHAKPTTILVPTRTSQAVTDLLAKGAHGVDEDDHRRKSLISGMSVSCL